MTNINRRGFIALGAGAFASAGVMPLFAAKDRQQWYEEEVSGDALLDMPMMEGFKPTTIEIKVGAKKPFEMLHISDSHLVTLGADDVAKADKDDLAHFRRRLKGFGHPENVTQYICGATFNGNAYHIRFV